MSHNPVNSRDMINATRAALARLGLVNGTPPVAPPPSPVPLEYEDEVIISPLPSPPGTPQQQVYGTPQQPPSMGRRGLLVQQRADDDFAPEQLPRRLFGNETPPREPVWRFANNQVSNIMKSLRY